MRDRYVDADIERVLRDLKTYGGGMRVAHDLTAMENILGDYIGTSDFRSLPKKQRERLWTLYNGIRNAKESLGDAMTALLQLTVKF